MVWVETTENITLPQPPALQPDGNTLRYTVTLVTPAAPTDERWRQAGVALFGLPGTVASACVGKPQMIGGWNSIKREPLPLRAHLPAGSTFFMEADASELSAVQQRHGEHIGEMTSWGYGQILIGAWI
jgi:CRISPR-associated protein Cmr3